MKPRIYAWLLTLGAVALVLTLAFTEGRPEFTAVLFWVVLLAAVELLPVSLGFGSEVTMGFPIHLAVAIIFRNMPWVPIVIAGIGALDMRELRREIPFWRASFNRSQTMLAVGGASLVFHLFSESAFNPIVVGAAALLHLIINLTLVAVMVNLDQGVPIKEAFGVLIPKPVSGFGVSYVLLTSLGVVTAVADREIGSWAVAAILIPLLFARLSILGARAQQELSEKIRQQQKALLEATERVFQEREEERNRIAEEIHDGSLQMLAAAAYGCGNAGEFIDAGRTDLAKEATVTARDAINGAMKALRDSLVDLRKSSVEEGGLIKTIEKFAEHLAVLWGTEIRIEAGLSAEPPRPVALAAFQILQEGLTNALKHAQGSWVTISITDPDGMVHIVVEDQGAGFDPSEKVGADHVGMKLMNERAERVGGRIELNSEPGRGTKLEAILPGAVTQ